MTQALLGVFLAAAALLTLRRGPAWAYGWVLIPALILVPPGIEVNVPALPDLSPRRVACLGILAGAVLAGSASRLLPRLRLVDFLVIAATVWFSISFGVQTDFRGFIHKVAILSMDWLMPYLFARGLFRDVRGLRVLIGPLALSLGIHGFLSLYETRMATRIGLEIWSALIGYPVPTHWLSGTAWRWGLLRAFGLYNHPIYMGVLFASLVPLIALLGVLQKKPKSMLVAAFFGLGGLFASLSRGPWLAFFAACFVYTTLCLFEARVVVTIGVGAALAALPFVLEFLGEAIEVTREGLAEVGNVESGYYRIALFLIYGEQIAEVGWFGDPSVVASEYSDAWSIDNAYLYLFIAGGWGGGSIMLAIVILQLFAAFRSVARASGDRRRIRASIGASFTSMALCMVNVWFAADFAPFFFITSALVTNASSRAFFLEGAPAKARMVEQPTATAQPPANRPGSEPAKPRRDASALRSPAARRRRTG